MDPSIEDRVRTLEQELVAAVHEVDAALEEGESERQLAAGRLVRELGERYQDVLAAASESDRALLERRIGRRLVDLRRSAASLVRRDSGTKVALSQDAGFVPFLERRAPPKAMEFDRTALRTTGVAVGAEVESWCGKCKEMTSHRIAAVSGGEAKQVSCDTCGSRHGHRAEPPPRSRAAKESGSAGVDVPRSKNPAESKKQEDKRKLHNELALATDVRPFDPKATYKAGEIIEHPRYGRGKIENVTRSSLLVRFNEGLKPINLF